MKEDSLISIIYRMFADKHKEKKEKIASTPVFYKEQDSLIDRICNNRIFINILSVVGVILALIFVPPLIGFLLSFIPIFDKFLCSQINFGSCTVLGWLGMLVLIVILGVFGVLYMLVDEIRD